MLVSSMDIYHALQPGPNSTNIQQVHAGMKSCWEMPKEQLTAEPTHTPTCAVHSPTFVMFSARH